MKPAKANLEVFAETLLELARRDRDILVLTSDSRGSGKLTRFGSCFLNNSLRSESPSKTWWESPPAWLRQGKRFSRCLQHAF